MLCCVVHSYLVIKQIEVTYLFHCLLNIHRCYAKLCYMSFTTKYFIDEIQGHWQNSGTGDTRRSSGSHCPCTPCGWSSSWQGLCPSSSSSHHLMSPSSPCGTCGGGMALLHCGVAVSARQVGH